MKKIKLLENYIEQGNVKIISRKDIPSLHSASIEGKTYYLGILKDFRKHPDLANFIPEDSRLSMSWVHLGVDEVLKTHIHPVKSLILVCSGELNLVGDIEASVKEGDAILIPPLCSHGLIGSGEKGFWGISIQFEQRGLYENPDEPLAQFLPEPTISSSQTALKKKTFSDLLYQSSENCLLFSKNPLFVFLQDPHSNAELLRDKFLNYFQVWSSAFQKMVLAREVFCHNPRFKALTRSHLEEEFGHDQKLQSDRLDKTEVWDPTLDALCSWFPWKILSLDEYAKTVLVHLVVEASATVAYANIPLSFGDSINSDHFSHHNTVDGDHSKMGVEFLEDLSSEEYAYLHQVQQEGWDVLNKIFERIYILLRENDSKL